jgi:hypothetical protein
MARLDRAIGDNTMERAMTRSSRAMTWAEHDHSYSNIVGSVDGMYACFTGLTNPSN